MIKYYCFPRFLFKMVKLYRNIEKTVVGGKDAEYFSEYKDTIIVVDLMNHQTTDLLACL